MPLLQSLQSLRKRTNISFIVINFYVSLKFRKRQKVEREVGSKLEASGLIRFKWIKKRRSGECCRQGLTDGRAAQSVKRRASIRKVTTFESRFGRCILFFSSYRTLGSICIRTHVTNNSDLYGTNPIHQSDMWYLESCFSKI